MLSPRQALQKHRSLRSLLFIFCCFFLSSGIYLSWMYHLSAFVSDAAVDFYTLIAAYLCQAAGLALFALLCQNRPSLITLPACALCLLLMMLCSVPAIRSALLSGVLLFGLLANLFIGLLAGFYLWDLSLQVDENRRGLVFGCAYGCATVAMWLASLIGTEPLPQTGYAFLLYLPAAALLLVFFPAGAAPEEVGAPSAGRVPLPAGSRSLILLTALTVFFLSLVKGIGFDFPLFDLARGVSLEFSRILYAVGLLAAGLIADRSRKAGAVCTLAALITPFILLTLRGEPISATVFWAIDYLFFGFFSVFRVLCFSDLSKKLSEPFLAGFGLLFGRLGDAVGASVNLLLSGRTAPLVLVAALLFFLTVFLFFRFYQKSYLSDPAKEKNDRELFERFSGQYGLSPKERSVMRLVIEERSNAEIAQSLFVSESTVKFHIHNILKKTACKNRATLLDCYRESGAAAER